MMNAPANDQKAPANQPPAIALYRGTLMHARLKPFAHRFSYRVFNILIDLDRLSEAHTKSPLFKVNRPACLSFHEKDHGDGKGHDLASRIRQQLHEAGVTPPIHRLLLLCYPRVFGYVFNPISIYYCFSNDRLTAMIYEVRNTFGGKYSYIEPVKEKTTTGHSIKQQCEKKLHVSPFLTMKMRYFFHITIPEERLLIRIIEKDQEGPVLSAILKSENIAFTTRNIAACLFLIPMMTLKVMGSIHWQALKLWLKGAEFIPNPHRLDTR